MLSLSKCYSRQASSNIYTQLITNPLLFSLEDRQTHFSSLVFESVVPSHLSEFAFFLPSRPLRILSHFNDSERSAISQDDK